MVHRPCRPSRRSPPPSSRSRRRPPPGPRRGRHRPPGRNRRAAARTRPGGIARPGGDAGQRPPVEAAVEDDEAGALRASGLEMVFARRLQAGLDGLGARIAEEDGVGEARRDQPFGEPRLARDAIEVRAVPELRRLGAQRLHQPGMGVPGRRDRHAGAEVEETAAVDRLEPDPLAPLERDVRAGVARHHRRYHLASSIEDGPPPAPRPRTIGRRSGRDQSRAGGAVDGAGVSGGAKGSAAG